MDGAFWGTLLLGTLLVFIAYLKTLQSASQGLWPPTRPKTVEANIDRVLRSWTEDTVRSARRRRPADAARGHLRLEGVTVGTNPAGRCCTKSAGTRARQAALSALPALASNPGRSAPRLLIRGRSRRSTAWTCALNLAGLRSRVAWCCRSVPAAFKHWRISPTVGRRARANQAAASGQRR